MKPIGTITKYYAFIDEQTKFMLKELMEKSSSYFDFVLRLSSLVLENEASSILAYIAASQAWWVQHEETIELINEKYGEIPCVFPWGFSHKSDVTDYSEQIISDATEIAIETLTEDWMKAELRLLQTCFQIPWGNYTSLIEKLREARILIEDNPHLRCFYPLVLYGDAWVEYLEGNLEEANAKSLEGQKIADEFNDELYAYFILSNRANFIKDLNHKEAISIYEELYIIAMSFEVPHFIEEILNDSALVYEATGEYDLTIASIVELINISPVGYYDPCPTILSRVYATLGEGEEALLWAERLLECGGDVNHIAYYTRKAHALIVLNRLDEAEQYLDSAHNLILKSGYEYILGIYYILIGLLELGKNNPSVALNHLSDAYNIFLRNPKRIYQNMSLLGLARAELEMQDNDSPIVGTWLSALENHAIEHDLPGIIMLTALLKSEFYQKKELFNDAREVLERAYRSSDSPGVKTLKQRISWQINELNQLSRKTEFA